MPNQIFLYTGFNCGDIIVNQTEYASQEYKEINIGINMGNITINLVDHEHFYLKINIGINVGYITINLPSYEYFSFNEEEFKQLNIKINLRYIIVNSVD